VSRVSSSAISREVLFASSQWEIPSVDRIAYLSL
jgi:hypothetical protein